MRGDLYNQGLCISPGCTCSDEHYKECGNHKARMEGKDFIDVLVGGDYGFGKELNDQMNEIDKNKEENDRSNT